MTIPTNRPPLSNKLSIVKRVNQPIKSKPNNDINFKLLGADIFASSRNSGRVFPESENEWIDITGLSDQKGFSTIDQLNVILKKIAFDLYDQLSRGRFLLPETCLIKKTNQAVAAVESQKSKCINLALKPVIGWENIAHTSALYQGRNIKFHEFIHETGRPPESITFKNKAYQLRGFMEILAVARLIGDKYVFGYPKNQAYIGDHIGFVIMEDRVKNQFAQVIKTNVELPVFDNIRSILNETVEFGRNIKLGLVAGKDAVIKWNKLTAMQQMEFLSVLAPALRELMNIPTLEYLIFRGDQFSFTNFQPHKKLWEILELIKTNIGQLKSSYRIKLNQYDGRLTKEYVKVEVKPSPSYVIAYLESILDQSEDKVRKIKDKIINCYKYQEPSLVLQGAGLVSLPEKIFTYLTHLTKLDLSNNQLISLPEDIGTLARLKILDLRGNERLELPESINELTAKIELSKEQEISFIENMLNDWANYEQANQTNNKENIQKAQEIILTCYKNQESSLTLNSLSLSSLPKNIFIYLNKLTNLNLDRSKLTSFPESIKNLTNLTYLYLGFNQFRNLPNNIGKLFKLRTLILYNNQINKLDMEIGNLTSLIELRLDCNQLIELPIDIGKLVNLTTLYLYSNQINDLPDSIGNLTNLTRLDLHDNKLTKLEENIGKLIKLTDLTLQDNQIAMLDESIGNLTNLTRLYLYNNKLIELPKSIGNLAKLTQLNLGNNQIAMLDNSIGSLTNLVNLDLTDNKNLVLPKSIAKLNAEIQLPKEKDGDYLNIILEDWINSGPNDEKEIRKKAQERIISCYKNQEASLNLGNFLSNLPKNIFISLTNLTDLSLYGNKLSELPKSLAKLNKLTRLTLSINRIAVLDESISNLINLTMLRLDNNKLSELPKSLAKLNKLSDLSLDRNQIAVLDESIGNLTNLQHLYAHDNQLQKVPKEIGNLANLALLYLYNNKLTQLPESIGNLTNLQHLYAHDNQLQKVPKGIGNLANLARLYLHGNKLTKLPKTMWNLTKLTELNLGNNQIAMLDNSIGSLTNLVNLDLTDNKNLVLPKSIAKLNAEIKLSKEKVEDYLNIILEDWINTGPSDEKENRKKAQEKIISCYKKQESSLDLSNLNLNSLPEKIFSHLIQLTSLRLDQNNLTTLPKNIENLVNLTELFLYSNQISILDKRLEKLTKLTYLYLHKNQISKFPENIGNLPNLVRLDLSSNQLTTLPASLGKLGKLTNLILYKNQINELPDSIDNLTNLTRLDLSNNQLVKLPNTFGNLNKSIHLDLANNPLHDGEKSRIKNLFERVNL